MKVARIIARKIAIKYLENQYINAKKYLENVIKNGCKDRNIDKICEAVRCAGSAYASVTNHQFSKDGSFFDILLYDDFMQKVEDDICKIKNGIWQKNVLVLGISGSGKAHHPWDDLKSCSCDCKKRPLLMYEKNKLYYCGGPTDNVFAICPSCGRHTDKSDIVTAIKNWNNDVTTKVRDERKE